MWMMLHGFTGSPRSYRSVLRHMGFEQPPLIPALTGHGVDWQSRAVDSFEGEVSRLISLLTEVEGPRLLCGYSLGARVALGMLRREPNMFDGAVLIGVHPGLTDESARDERREIDARRARLLRDEGLAAFVDVWEALPLFASQRDLPVERLAEQRENRLSHAPEGLARSIEVLGLAEMPAHGPGMASLDTPTTLMTGSLDDKFSELAAELAKDNAHIDVELVEGAGHNVLLEAPAAVAATMQRVQEMVGR